MRSNKLPPALKLGIYSCLGVLPTEDSDQFQKLVEELTATYRPQGVAETQTVRELARYLWRQQNLPTLRRAKLARDHAKALRGDAPDSLAESLVPAETLKFSRAAQKAADKRARKDLGDAYPLVELGEIVSFQGLAEELALYEQLSSLIDRCVKRLLFLKGLATLVSPQASVTPRQLTQGQNARVSDIASPGS